MVNNSRSTKIFQKVKYFKKSCSPIPDAQFHCVDQPLLQISYVSFQTFYVCTKPRVADLRMFLYSSYFTELEFLVFFYQFHTVLILTLVHWIFCPPPPVFFYLQTCCGLTCQQVPLQQLMGRVVHGNYQGWWGNVTS